MVKKIHGLLVAAITLTATQGLALENDQNRQALAETPKPHHTTIPSHKHKKPALHRKSAKTARLTTQTAWQEPISGGLSSSQDEVDDLTPSWIFQRGTPLTSSPYLGIHSEFFGNDLIVNYSQINEDLRLLLARQRQENYLLAHDLPLASHPKIVVSGKIEADATTQSTYNNGNQSDITLATGELNVIPEVNRWVTGFIGIDYDSTAPAPNISYRRIANSRIFLNKGFVTIGNLNSFPLRVTVGQMFLPFGRYSSSMIVSPLTQSLARTNARTLLLGYHGQHKSGPYGEIFAFPGDARTGNRTSTINDWGADIGYTYEGNSFTIYCGAGFLSDLSQSDGMQATGDGAYFPGFSIPYTAANVSRETLVHTVPAAEVRTAVNFNKLTLIGELVGATRRYAMTNLTFNGHGAQPSALNLEGNYGFTLFDKPANIGIGYQQTNQALALALPKQRYVAVINYGAFRDTILSLEYRHENNYGAGDSSDGTFTGNTPKNITTDTRLGKQADVVTAQVGIYF